MVQIFNSVTEQTQLSQIYS